MQHFMYQSIQIFTRILSRVNLNLEIFLIGIAKNILFRDIFVFDAWLSDLDSCCKHTEDYNQIQEGCLFR